MGKKKANTASVVNVPETPFMRFQSSLRAWLEARKQSMAVLEKLLELRTQLTYTTTEKVQSVLGAAMGAGRLHVQVEAELYGQLLRLETTQGSMLTCLQTMRASYSAVTAAGAAAAATDSNNTADSADSNSTDAWCDGDGTGAQASSSAWPLEEGFTDSLLSDLQQQTLVELSVYEMLKEEQQQQQQQSAGDGGQPLDHDAVVTCLACFTYPPYISTDALESVLEVRE